MYDRVASKYDELFVDNQSIAEDQQVAAMLKPFNGTICDVGCGTGLLLTLKDIKPKYYLGIDPSFGMLMCLKNKHKQYQNRLANDTFESFFETAIGYDNIISLYGSISYVSKECIRKLNDVKCNLFLMFYKPDYFPKTYTMCGVEFSHNIYTVDELEKIFSNSEVFEFNNYIIVKRLCK